MQTRKTHRLRTAPLAATAVLLLGLAPRPADALTLTFAGPLDVVGIFGDATGLWAGLSPGTTGTLTVEFNFTGTDLTASPDSFISHDSINGAQLVIGAHTRDFGSGAVIVVNDFAGLDQFVLNLNPVDQIPGATLDFGGLQFLFTDATGTLFSSAGLEPALTAMIGGSGQFDLLGPGNEARGTFRVSHGNPVPDAGASGLFLAGSFAGLAGIHAFRRRQAAIPASNPG